MTKTWTEQGMDQGLHQGRLEILQLQIEDRFKRGLTSEMKERLASLPTERLKRLAVELMNASSLKELGLED